MSKRFDCENEPNEFMDMPCRCDCGQWFDLNDGYGHGRKVVCKNCHEVEEEVLLLRDKYRDLDYSDKPNKRAKAKILKRLAEIGHDLDTY